MRAMIFTLAALFVLGTVSLIAAPEADADHWYWTGTGWRWYSTPVYTTSPYAYPAYYPTYRSYYYPTYRSYYPTYHRTYWPRSGFSFRLGF